RSTQPSPRRPCSGAVTIAQTIDGSPACPRGRKRTGIEPAGRASPHVPSDLKSEPSTSIGNASPSDPSTTENLRKSASANGSPCQDICGQRSQSREEIGRHLVPPRSARSLRPTRRVGSKLSHSRDGVPSKLERDARRREAV